MESTTLSLQRKAFLVTAALIAVSAAALALAGRQVRAATVEETTLLLVGLGAGGLGFGLAWLRARRIKRPLRSLSSAMAEMARSGELRTDFASVGGDPEVKLIEETFRQLVVSLEESQRARERSYVEAVGAVVTAADARDHETTGHSFRVAHYAVTLAKAMGIRGETLKAIEWGSLLHDVGKMVVPDEILRKVGPLTEAEWHIMRQHPNWGFDMLAEVGFLQQPALEIVYSHHERWDGAGYPRGLAGESIPLAARIFAVVDTYDAITSDRPYRRARSHQAAMAELQRVAGHQLDPAGRRRLPQHPRGRAAPPARAVQAHPSGPLPAARPARRHDRARHRRARGPRRAPRALGVIPQGIPYRRRFSHSALRLMPRSAAARPWWPRV